MNVAPEIGRAHVCSARPTLFPSTTLFRSFRQLVALMIGPVEEFQDALGGFRFGLILVHQDERGPGDRKSTRLQRQTYPLSLHDALPIFPPACRPDDRPSRRISGRSGRFPVWTDSCASG